MVICNIMISLFTVSKSQNIIAKQLRSRRLVMGLTQEGLATRSGVALPTLRKFEQKGIISLESFLKLLMILNALEAVVKATASEETEFSTIDEVLEVDKKKMRKKGWRK